MKWQPWLKLLSVSFLNTQINPLIKACRNSGRENANYAILSTLSLFTVRHWGTGNVTQLRGRAGKCELSSAYKSQLWNPQQKILRTPGVQGSSTYSVTKMVAAGTRPQTNSWKVRSELSNDRTDWLKVDLASHVNKTNETNAIQEWLSSLRTPCQLPRAPSSGRMCFRSTLLG